MIRNTHTLFFYTKMITMLHFIKKRKDWNYDLRRKCDKRI